MESTQGAGLRPSLLGSSPVPHIENKAGPSATPRGEWKLKNLESPIILYTLDWVAERRPQSGQGLSEV